VRRYETIFILRSDLGESQVKDSIKRFEGLVATGGGEMLETDEWGFRELAYRIHNERRGYYVRLDYAATGPVMNEVERNLKLSDSVLRYLSVLLDPEVDTAKVRAEIEASLRRLGTAHIDVYFMHNFDALTPVDETNSRPRKPPQRSHVWLGHKTHERG